jgi:hypothetical protein
MLNVIFFVSTPLETPELKAQELQERPGQIFLP